MQRNWIYRSDDNLYASRWHQILDPAFDPDFVQIISWNDYGESHYIGPILGAQPGSEAWTRNRDHAAWREMTRYFVQEFKGLPRSKPRVSFMRQETRPLSLTLRPEQDLEVWLTYRTHRKDLLLPNDVVGRPDHADWVSLLLYIRKILPMTSS